MNKLKAFIAIAACKLSRRAIRLLGRGGTDFPGKIALRICPNLLGLLAKGVRVIIVTGTNGKTTSSRMIEQALIDSGKTYLANKSGANLLSGITAEFAVRASLTGKTDFEYAVVECDEAAFKQVSRLVDAQVVLVTNVFRDQLDRYGEVSHTLENILIGVINSPHATLCLNADCSLTSSLAREVDYPTVFYGVNCPVYRQRVAELSDAPYCIRCKGEYSYSYTTYGHLGGWSCPSCGYSRSDPDVAVTAVESSDDKGSRITVSIGGAERNIFVALPGAYNIYNAAGALSVCRVLGLDEDSAAASLSRFECGFGRMESFQVEGRELRMILIKNPAGCNQVLNFLSSMTTPSLFVVCLNDRSADGTDVSWIWDVDFEELCSLGDTLSGVLVSGVRGSDMAVRFKYAGLGDKLRLIEDYDSLIDAMLAQDKPVYIMPTYTAMLDLREKISRRFGFKDFWE